MNRLKVVSLGLLFCSINPVASYVLAANEVEGSISMAQHADGGGATCVVELKTMQIDLGYYKECRRDKLNFFKLNGVPSGTTIEFNSNAQCSPKGNWHYTVRTYIEPTDTIYIYLFLTSFLRISLKTLFTKGCCWSLIIITVDI
ncbi:hypothetical protein PF66_02760 [Pseudomonas asplenii]|uniref:Uncharacterized protein n=1 Tax=Pseudomonas asplenii TaxID=53407 RepID=A0A0M9GGL1_9PSED|nr:hypothetical protein [Pseudomonas fuscovaginae]KPA90698.1 hypothetical protein PF66_02760 [Pseudomonas fuscovaginae]